ncbi:MAG: type II toxin-antitoxin system VapC family toxin [Acidimicrobiales bacterium]
MDVVDASAAVLALRADGEARRRLRQVRLQAPCLIDAEVTQALRRAEQRGELAPDAAVLALRTWRRLGIRRHRMPGLLPRVWALRHNLSSYDATYVALAEILGCPLVTADGRLATAPGVRCPVALVTT